MAAVSKSFFTVSAVAFALMFGGGVYVLKNLNILAKPITERIASEALGVSVNIGALDIRLQEKRVGVSNIRIGNPTGFAKPHAITIDRADIALKGVSKTLLDFETVDVAGTSVFLEVQKGTTNLHSLKKGIKGGKAQEKADEALKVILRNFALRGGTIYPSVTLIESQDLKPVNVSPIVLRGIGVRENGVLAHEAAAQVVKPLIDTFSKDAGNAGYYQGLSSDALKEIGAGQMDQIKTRINEEVDKLEEGIKNLFQ
ncbi:MAG: hypothetical protein AAF204_03535 [Pseudomonadota bacterium]